MVGWHHWCNGHEFEQSPGVGDGQGSLACCGSWLSDWTDWTEVFNSSSLVLFVYMSESVDMNLSKLQETVEDKGAWRAVVHGVTKSWTWLSNWMSTTTYFFCTYFPLPQDLYIFNIHLYVYISVYIFPLPLDLEHLKYYPCNSVTWKLVRLPGPNLGQNL